MQEVAAVSVAAPLPSSFQRLAVEALRRISGLHRELHSLEAPGDHAGCASGASRAADLLEAADLPVPITEDTLKQFQICTRGFGAGSLATGMELLRYPARVPHEVRECQARLDALRRGSKLEPFVYAWYSARRRRGQRKEGSGGSGKRGAPPQAAEAPPAKRRLVDGGGSSDGASP